jgi:hypothetical protein
MVHRLLVVQFLLSHEQHTLMVMWDLTLRDPRVQPQMQNKLTMANRLKDLRHQVNLTGLLTTLP